MATRNQLFRPSITQKPGIFQPVTGQAVVVVTTAVDQAHADEMKRSMTSKGGKKVYNNTAHVDVVRRVESHLVALKKKGRNRRQFRGTGADLKIFTAINGLNRDELIENYEHVGVVQTPINPNDKTKPKGFETNATRIGGTVSLINTGPDTIPANVPVYWDAPPEDVKESECGSIRGHPEGAVYPSTRALTTSTEEAIIRDIIASDLALSSSSSSLDPVLMAKRVVRALGVRDRIIGWSIAESQPGHQLDLILKK